jgi:hypothetical protein
MNTLDMSHTARNNAAKTRGRPFKPGNPGRPKGARHRITVAAETLLDGEAEALTRKAIEMALAGDTAALRLCLERIVAPRRDRSVRFMLPPLQSPADAAAAMAAIAAGVASSSITPGEAAELVKLVEGYLKALEVTDFDQRLRAIEESRDATRS